MSGLLRRLSRRRPATADETGTTAPESSEPAGAPAESPAEPGGGQPVPDEQATQVLPATAVQPAQPVADEPHAQPPAEAAVPAPVRDLPAGIDPSELATGPAPSASRGKLRRRLRYLRSVRDLLLRDLGGFMYELHRTAGDTPLEPQRKLAESKTRRIESLDAEVRAIETQLGEPHAGAVLREPGIGGLCPECGELHASDAHYCSRCGAPLNAKARAKRDAAVAAAAQPMTGSQPAAETAPASVLWAGGPKPRVQTEPEAERETTEPSVVTNEWLALPKRPEDAPAATRPAPKPGAGDESAATGDPTAGDESAATGDPTAGDESAATGEPAAGDEPAATGAPTAGDESAATAGAGTRANESAAIAGDEPAAGADAAASDEAGADDPARATERAEDFEPNGKRGDDVPEPEPLGDPLSSRREQGS